MSENALLNVTIGGMSCGHCVVSIEKAIRGVPGVEDVDVDLKSGLGAVRLVPGASPETLGKSILAAIKDIGFTAELKQK